MVHTKCPKCDKTIWYDAKANGVIKCSNCKTKIKI